MTFVAIVVVLLALGSGVLVGAADGDSAAPHHTIRSTGTVVEEETPELIKSQLSDSRIRKSTQ